MIKKLFLAVAVVFFTSSMFSQNFKKGDKALNVGIGLGWSYTSGYTGISTLAPIPSFNASFEAGIVDIPNVGVIGVGGFGSFRTTWDKGGIYGYDYIYRYNNSFIAARGVFHFQFFDTGNFDLYAGVHGGLRIHNYSYNIDYNGDFPDYTESDNDVDPIADVFAGARWMKNNKFGFFAELGYGISYLKAGIVFKF